MRGRNQIYSLPMRCPFCQYYLLNKPLFPAELKCDCHISISHRQWELFKGILFYSLLLILLPIPMLISGCFYYRGSTGFHVLQSPPFSKFSWLFLNISSSMWTFSSFNSKTHTCTRVLIWMALNFYFNGRIHILWYENISFRNAYNFLFIHVFFCALIWHWPP